MGLSIIDAVKSGKNFRRKSLGLGFWTNSTKAEYILDKESILATDWEIEERKIEISENEFDEALSEAEQVYGRIGINFIRELKKRLFG